ncbi:MAG: hypothetical protein JWO67_5314, partial [Streptosporangiaceae bacterium]|nr:hypothetical protein [Streptosporangiaceae bacterium]
MGREIGARKLLATRAVCGPAPLSAGSIELAKMPSHIRVRLQATAWALSLGITDTEVRITGSDLLERVSPGAVTWL